MEEKKVRKIIKNKGGLVVKNKVERKRKHNFLLEESKRK